MRIGTLVTGVLAMAAGFGLAAIVIGWPVLVVGVPIVFGGSVVVLVTWLNGMHQQHARAQRYAHAGDDDAWYDHDGDWPAERFDRGPSGDEDTLDSDDAWAGAPAADDPAMGLAASTETEPSARDASSGSSAPESGT